MKRLLLVLAIFLISGQALSSDQKLVHGAGTLPHLNLALSVEPGYAFPTPVVGSLRIDMGIGNRVQLGISQYMSVSYNGIEYHSLFNVLKTPRDSDFLSIYFNPGYYIGMERVYFWIPYPYVYIIRSGIAYEHRFYKKRRMGFYVKVGIIAFVGDKGVEEINLELDPDLISLDIRVGYQALLGKSFSVALEPMLLINLPLEQSLLGGKLSLSWTFDLKQTELFKPRANKY